MSRKSSRRSPQNQPPHRPLDQRIAAGLRQAEESHQQTMAARQLELLQAGDELSRHGTTATANIYAQLFVREYAVKMASAAKEAGEVGQIDVRKVLDQIPCETLARIARAAAVRMLVGIGFIDPESDRSQPGNTPEGSEQDREDSDRPAIVPERGEDSSGETSISRGIVGPDGSVVRR